MGLDGGSDPQRVRRAKSKHAGGVCATARVEAKPGADERIAALLADMAFAVRAEEDGCVSYAVTRMMGSKDYFAIHARFATWAAFKAHAETAHMDRLLVRLNPLMAAPVALEIFLEV